MCNSKNDFTKRWGDDEGEEWKGEGELSDLKLDDHIPCIVCGHKLASLTVREFLEKTKNPTPETAEWVSARMIHWTCAYNFIGKIREAFKGYLE